MSLTKAEFEVLHALVRSGDKTSQRKLAELTGLSLGTVNTALKSCSASGYVENGIITHAGIEALEPYRVENAVIMAAGLSSRFAPISYEKPKGLLRVRGEVLIERQITQLLEAGITDITVVVGYKREYFFYLEAKFGVRIVVNNEYDSRNNNGTLYLVRERLGNTFVCSSDDYFTENPFERYVYKAYYAAEYADGPTKEWCMEIGPGGRITKVTVGGEYAPYMLGHAYFDRAFSKRFVEILEAEYNLPETADKLWETIYAEHIKELDMVVRRYPDGVINEFDSLDELEGFDPEFISNIDSEVFDNIVSVLGCAREDIHDFYPVSQGLTNLSCHFAVGDNEYIYRHPGVGTEKFINRKAELDADTAAHELGVDRTFIHMSEKGWKLSHFVPNARTVDPKDPADVAMAMETARKIHESGAVIETKFDFFADGVGYEELLLEHGPIDIPGYYEMREKIVRLNEYSSNDGLGTEGFSHNDYLPLNLLIGEDGTMDVIDWEFAGMGDAGNDTATFIICSEYDQAEGDAAIEAYFGRKPTFEERRHFWARVVLGGWCWYVWALEKEAEGAGVGEWLYIYYRYAANYIDMVLDWYEKGEK